MTSPIVSTEWLQENLDQEGLVILDASMSKIIGKEPIIYERPLYIPGSQFINLERELCDLTSDQVHAFPTAEQFAQEMQRQGVTAENTIVIYDNQGVYSSPRAWWIFKTMGFEKVYVLDGGLPKWMEEGRTVVARPGTETSLDEAPGVQPVPENVRDASYLLENITGNTANVVDARSRARFLGEVEEPRPGLRSGHIPGSFSLPFTEVLDDTQFKSKAALAEVFEGLELDKSKPSVFTCGSGVTACIILMAADILGYENLSLYDGSWSEWGADESLPIE